MFKMESTSPKLVGVSSIPLHSFSGFLETLIMEGPSGVRKGAWSKEEDDLLRACIRHYGEGNWHLVPRRSGLNRCRKSCRLRWLNYVKPTIKRKDFAEDEIDIMIRMHKLLGNRWSLIARRLPGRTSNDVKNFWNTQMRKNKALNQKPKETAKTHVVVKPQARTFSKNSPWLRGKLPIAPSNQHESANNSFSSSSSHVLVVSAASALPQSQENWWETLLEDPGSKEDITCCLNRTDGNFIYDLWDGDEFSEMSTKDNEFLMEDPIGWSHFLLLDTNLCGSPP